MCVHPFPAFPRLLQHPKEHDYSTLTHGIGVGSSVHMHTYCILHTSALLEGKEKTVGQGFTLKITFIKLKNEERKILFLRKIKEINDPFV